MSQRLAGKVAVITGGSSGIGLATAKRFVDEGAYVFITGRREEGELDAAVKEIGHDVTGVQGDASKLADIDTLYAAVKEQKASSILSLLMPAPASLLRLAKLPKNTLTNSLT